MSPPCAAFPPSKLDVHVQADVKGKKRKLPGGADVDLTKCALKEMTQYRCFVENSQSRNSPVRCWPIHRLFRQCQDKKGTFMVETTAWEGSKSDPTTTTRHNSQAIGNGKSQDGHSSEPSYHQWSQSWEDE
ncbi:hypothetical protein CCUS01_16145 [Colletotrichum cuscutae]|uniref:Uncharacterized protein n=1 Tax=Colletotrichum cuscutae TaxID=1209917 RepID=A0AAI9VGT1_9PEZI|nr:hypothetical protein CCUS01_16145 [Colletotrichum cuscutae]